MKRAKTAGGFVLMAVLLTNLAACDNSLQDELDSARKELEAAKSKAKELEASLAAETAAKAELEGNIASLNAQKTALEKEKADLEAALGASEAGKAEIKAGLEAELEEVNDQIQAITLQIAGLNDQITGLNTQISELIAEKNVLNGQVETLTGQKSALETQLAAAIASGTASEAEIAELQGDIAALGTQIEGLEAERDDLREEKERLEALVTSLSGQVTSLTTNVNNLITEKNGLRTQLDAAEADKVTLQGQITALGTQIAGLDTEIAGLEEQLGRMSAEAALMSKNISVMKVGGQEHTAEWHAEHEANVLAAQSMGQEATTVFVGDGVIRAMWDDKIGIIDNATALGKIANLKTQRAFVIGAAGDNIGDLNWKLGERAADDETPPTTEMPARAAYIISHAGQWEVTKSGLGTTDDNGIAPRVGEQIGIFYALLQARYPDASTVFAGIIPSNSIGTGNNTTYINTQIQAAIGDTSGTTNKLLNTDTNSSSTTAATGINYLLNIMTSNVAMHRRNSVPQKLSPQEEIIRAEVDEYLAMERSLKSKGYYYDEKENVVYIPNKYKTIMDDWTPSIRALAQGRSVNATQEWRSPFVAG